MRTSFLSLIVIVLVLVLGMGVNAQEMLTGNLSFGSRGAQVTLLQQLLNRDSDTRIALTGPGSPGNETAHFGLLTKAAVIRLQEKYAAEILVPAGLTQGNGRVGSYTRAKLNVLSTAQTKSAMAPIEISTTTATSSSSSAEYVVKESEKVDIYVGDKMLANVQSRIYAAMNTSIASHIAARAASVSGTASGSTTPIIVPKITSNDIPRIAIGVPTPRTGAPGTYVSIKGTGITSLSVMYFGNTYIVRKISTSPGDTFIFKVPPIPYGRYDLAMRANGILSNTTAFVIRDPKSPSVHLESISPTTVPYGSTLTITGSGFTPENNVVVTTYQKFINVPSTDGKTLTVTLAPASLEEYVKVTGGKVELPMNIHVENDYGFSDAEKSFTLIL